MEDAICNSVLGDGFRWIGWLLDAAGEGEAGEGPGWRWLGVSAGGGNLLSTYAKR